MPNDSNSGDLFRGTASYYARFRPPYPAELIDKLVASYKVDRTVSVLDLGCGTGQLALPLAGYAGEVLGMDPEPEMLEVAETIARERGITNVLWRRGGSNDLERLRDERETEREVEQVGARQELGEHLPLRQLAADEPALELERAVGLGVERVAVEDDERRVDAPLPERLDVRPRHACRVDGAVDDAEGAAPRRAHGSHSSWSK